MKILIEFGPPGCIQFKSYFKWCRQAPIGSPVRTR